MISTLAQRDSIALALQLVPHDEAIATIRKLHATPAGAELLRTMVRDRFPGVGDLIVEALWVNL